MSTTNEQEPLAPTLKISVRCQSCTFYKRHAFFSAGGKPQPCATLGIAKNASACQHYVMDPLHSKNDILSLDGVQEFIGDLEDDQLLPLAALLVAEKKLRAKSLSVGLKNIAIKDVPSPTGKGRVTLKAQIVGFGKGVVYLVSTRGATLSFPIESIQRIVAKQFKK